MTEETTSAIEIVPYADRHRDGVRDLILPIQQDEFGIPITYEQQPDLHDIGGFYRRAKGDFWVAQADDRVVGTIALIDLGEGLAALRKMFVKRDYRGSKHRLAARLLTHLIDHARASGIATVLLGTTAAFHAAHRFYEKSGFQLVDEDELPASFPRMAVDTRFYRLSLD